MTLNDFAQLFALIGVLLLGLSTALLTGLFNNPSSGEGMPALVPWAKGPKYLLEDLRNPKVKYGGMLSILLRMLKLSIVSLAIGGMLWVVTLL